MNQLPEPNKPFDIRFDNGQVARTLYTVSDANADIVYRSFGFRETAPAIFIIGGAALMTERDQQLTQEMIEAVTQFAEERGAIVIDGGTESGIMKMVGDTRHKLGLTFPLIGVSPAGRVSYPGYKNPAEEAVLEDSHSHFVLVDGDEWGVESRMIIALTEAVCGHGEKPAVGILVNGGQIAMREVYLASTAERTIPVIVVEGSGRAADEISTAIRTGAKSGQTIMRAIIKGGDIQLVGTVEGAPAIRLKLVQKFAQFEA